MPDPASKAVFLSYASQDAEAAKRICEALRAAGVEVWFDQDALVGGDAWDAKIRGQIGSCALFIPVISAATQERLEGYFRLEWKLAANRSHTMAEEKTFLLPVVIDATRDAEGKVPTEFRAVQWTKLPGGETSPGFVTRLQKLLGGPSAAVAVAATVAALAPSSTPPPKKSTVPSAAIAVLAAAVLALVAFILLRPAAKEGSAAPAPSKSAAPSPVASSPASVATAKSIAVLPFENRSADKDNAYFTDGVHEDILTSLGNIRELRVISRTSVMEYRNTTKKIPQIAKELGVAFILEGSVQRAGNTVHITGQLIRAGTDEHVWAKNYDRELTASNLFAIQSELAQAIAGELQAAISPQEKTQLTRAPTSNLEAYELDSKGRELRNAFGPDIAGMFTAATPLWERAVVLDPNFAEAWANIGGAYILAYDRGIARTPEAKARAHDTIQTALRLAPDNPSVIFALAGYYTRIEGDYERALVECERAAKISRNNSGLYNTLSVIYLYQGRPVDALDALRKAHDLAPRSETIARGLGRLLLNARRYTEAEEVLRQALVLQPDSWLSAGALASLPLYARGSTREWDAWLAGVPAPTRTISAFQNLHVMVTADRGDAAEYAKLVAQYHSEATVSYGYAFALKLSGQTEQARAVAARIRDEQLALVARDPSNAQAWQRLAFAYTVLEEKSSALDAAEKSIAATGLPGQAWVRLPRAEVLAWLDRKDEALKELAAVWGKPMQTRDALTSFMWTPLKGDPRFEAFRNDPKNNAPLF